MSAAVDATASLLRRRLRTLGRVRWAVLAFGLAHVLTYAALPYPRGVRATAVAIIVAVAVVNLVLMVALDRLRPSTVRAVASTSVVVDLLALGGIVLLYAFDPASAIFTMLVLAPIEAALLFGLPAALWAWGGTAVLYLVREWYGIRYGNPWELQSVSFRLGLLLTVALVVGLLARDLQTQRQAAADALADARRADAWRSRLVTMLAHDLRSPLAGVRTGLGTLREHGAQLSEDTAGRVIDGGIRQVDRMLAMTRDLLDLARAEQGRLELDRRTVALATVVGRALAMVGLLDDEVQVEVPDDLVLVADPDRLEQVVANLVTNAVRHGHPPVEVAGQRDGDAIRLTVRDHGAGVSPGLRDRVFEPFATTDDGSDSVGLGTWVVAHLVRLHGGEVTYEDADPGARFVVTLPVGDVTRASAPSPSTAASRGPR